MMSLRDGALPSKQSPDQVVNSVFWRLLRKERSQLHINASLSPW